MSLNAPVVPEEGQMLCVGCGYVLSGLPADSRCPECGKPISESADSHRRPAAWEDPADACSAPRRFLATTAAVLRGPGPFFNQLETRRSGERARAFAWIHWAGASLVMGAALWLHLVWYVDVAFYDASAREVLASLLLPLPIFATCLGVTRLVVRLTSWEAAMRGLRLPPAIVLRALYYHAPHYWPPALLALAVTGGMHLLSLCGVISYYLVGPAYLYTLAGGVVLGAFHLFRTYWAAMRNIVFANR